MSQNLTQLGYDLSSFFNIAVEGEGGAMQKLQAAISGELEPIRRLGYDLSDARLQSVALSLGIDQATNSMTQAQKAQLRYYALMTQVTTAQGDMARTLNAPANQLRILKAQLEQTARAIGNIFIPALNKILPIAIAVVDAIGRIAQAVARLFGFSLPEVDYSGLESASGVAGDLDENLDSASGSAKKLNELLADWDELNIIQSESGGGGGSSSLLTGGDDWDWELPEYDFLAGYVGNSVDAIKDKIEPVVSWIEGHISDIISLAEGAGAAFLLWKLGESFIPGLSISDSLLSNIGQVAATLAASALTIVLNVEFMSKFLETGDYGALAGAAGVSVVGSTVAGKLVENMLKGKPNAKSVGSFTSGALLTITGAIDMQMTLEQIQTEGFTTKNITGLLTAAGITGMGLSKVLGALTEWMGVSTSKANIAGAAAVMTVGLGLSMYLDNKAASIEGLDSGTDLATWMGEKAGSALSSALTGYSAGQLIDPKNKKLGMTFAGISMVLSSSVSLITNLSEDAVENNLTHEQIEKKLWDAVADAVKAGGGVGLTVASAAGPVAGVIAGVGTALILTITSYAKFSMDKLLVEIHDNVMPQWGDTGLTVDEVRQKVQDLFDFDIEASVSTLTVAVTDRITLKEGVGSAGMQLSGDLLQLEAGINADTSWTNIKNTLWGEGETPGDKSLIGQAQKLLDQDTATLKAYMTVAGFKDLGDDNSLLKAFTADQVLSSELSTAGEEFMRLFTQGIETGFDNLTDDITQRMYDLVTYITGLTGAIKEGEAKAGFESLIGDLMLTDLTKESASDVLNQYAQYREDLFKGIRDSRNASISGLEGKKSGLQYMLDNWDTIDHGDYTMEQVNELIQVIDKDIAELKAQDDNATVSRLIGETEAEFKQWLYESLFEEGSFTGYGMDTYSTWNQQTMRGYHANTGELPLFWYSIGAIEDYQAYLKNQYGSTDYTAKEFEALMGLEFYGQEFFNQIDDLFDEATAERVKAYWTNSMDMGTNHLNFSEYLAGWLGDEEMAQSLIDAYGEDALKQDVMAILFDQFREYWGGDIDLSVPGAGNAQTSSEFADLIDRIKSDIAESDLGQLMIDLQDIENYISVLTEETPGINVDTDPAITELKSLKTQIQDTINAITAANGYSVNVKTNYSVSYLPTIPQIHIDGMFADGGFPDTGELFVARERGAELVGSIGNRTAVANNEQIEYGISMGVRDANAEQNELLRQQNQYLRIIAAKSGRAVLEPSTELARTVKRAEEMRLKSEGV